MNEEKKEEVNVEVEQKASSESKMNTNTQGSESNKTLMIFGIGVVVLLLVGIVAVFALFQNSSSSGSYNASTGIEEIDPYISDNIDLVLDSMDFDEFDPERPLDFIDFEAIADKAEQSAERLQYLSSPDLNELDLAGNTTHSALDLSFDVENQGQQMSVDLILDSYARYDEDYDQEKFAELQTSAEIISLIQNITDEEFSEIIDSVDYFIDIKMSVYGGVDGSLDGEMQLTVIDGIAYLYTERLENNGLIPPEDFSEISQIIGQTVRVDANESLSSIFSLYSESLSGVDASELSDLQDLRDFRNTDEYEELNAELAASFSVLPDEQIELIRSAGPGIKRSISENFRDVDFFTNIQAVDPIRDGSSSVCNQGEFNNDEVLEAVKAVILDSYDVITSDSNFDSEGLDIAEEREVLEESFEQVSIFVDLFDMEFTACHDEEMEYSTGGGVNIDYSILGSGIKFEINTLTVTYDSKFEFDVPKYDQDFTDDFNQIFEDLQYSVPVTVPLNFGTGTTALVEPIESFDSFDSVDISPEEEELLNRYINEEITFEEYMEGLEDIYGPM